MKILLLANTDWFLYRFERELAHALRAAGAEVVLAAPRGPYSERLETEGFRVRAIPMERRRILPWRELATLRHLTRLYRLERPDLVHHFTLKGVLYGAWAARRAGVPAVVGSITGLGHLYSSEGRWVRLLRWGVEGAGRWLLRGTRTLFLNHDDHDQFLQRRVVAPREAHLVASSGVDIERFSPRADDGEDHGEDHGEDRPLVVLAARLLRSKGIGTFLAAAQIHRRSVPDTRWVLVGATDPDNPDSLDDRALDVECRETGVERWGFVDDMIGLHRRAAIVCLPTTYREGVPTVLLEAAACGRPVVASDMPGCREAVVHGETGLLVPPDDPAALARAVAELLADPERRQAMGRRARQRVVEEFSVERVVAETLAIYRLAGLEIG